MTVEKIMIFAVLCSVLIVLLRNNRQEQAVILSIAAAVFLFVWLMDAMQPVLREVWGLLERFSLGEQQSEIVLKSLGLCLLTQIASDLCRDAGEATLAANVELAGKTAVLVLCLPLFRQLLDFAAALLQ